MLRKRVDQRQIEVTKMLASALRQMLQKVLKTIKKHAIRELLLYHICVNLMRKDLELFSYKILIIQS